MASREDLRKERCVACHRDSPRITPDEFDELSSLIPAWERVEVNGVPRLVRTFRFSNFAQALAFTNKVGQLAEEEGHHPLLETSWGRVKVSWWSHAIRGLHRNDVLMAAKTDALYGEDEPSDSALRAGECSS